MSLLSFRTALASALALALTFLAGDPAARADAGGDSSTPEAKLARARAAEAAKRWEEAARGFRDVAMSHPATEAGRSAVLPYLNALNAIGTRKESPKPSVYDDMARDVKPLFRLYCTGVDINVEPEPCLTLMLMRRDLVIQRYTAIARSPDARELEEKAAGYLELWRDAGEPLCIARHRSCASMGTLLLSASALFQRAGKWVEAVKARKILIDPRYGLERTEAAGTALAGLGEAYEANALFEYAVTWYEQLAETIPASYHAPRAFEGAVELRLLLGDAPKARKIAELFKKTYGTAHSAQFSRIELRLAQNDAANGDFKAARTRLTGAVARIDKEGPIDTQILAHALLGRAAVELGDAPRAALEYGKVQRAWKSPEEAMKKISSGITPEARALEALRDVLTAVGEALFFFAEQKRAEAIRLEAPVYKGPDDRRAILAYFSGTAAPWMKKKHRAITAADESYEAVLGIKPEAPPKWIIASAARVGFLWSDFADEMKVSSDTPESRRKGPIPGMNGVTYEELRAQYASQTQSSLEVLKGRAKDAFTFCLRISTRSSYFDEISRSCERWLAKSYPREHHALDELFGAPSRAYSLIKGRPATREAL